MLTESEILDEPMTLLQMLTVFAIAYDRQHSDNPIPIDPDDFFGCVSDIREALTAPKAVLKKILKRETHSDWNGSTNIWKFIIEESKARSAVDRAVASWGVENRRLEDAFRMKKYYDQMKTGVTENKYRDALAVIQEFGQMIAGRSSNGDAGNDGCGSSSATVGEIPAGEVAPDPDSESQT